MRQLDDPAGKYVSRLASVRALIFRDQLDTNCLSFRSVPSNLLDSREECCFVAPEITAQSILLQIAPRKGFGTETPSTGLQTDDWELGAWVDPEIGGFTGSSTSSRKGMSSTIVPGATWDLEKGPRPIQDPEQQPHAREKSGDGQAMTQNVREEVEVLCSEAAQTTQEADEVSVVRSTENATSESGKL
ncbi:hypothetical protein N0V82_002550 [Gnomoniopsis sp. IMI 355080]|nr:hypothetical protein N0V82_002550 [Gnomoniopsis sp. IMI 355080]